MNIISKAMIPLYIGRATPYYNNPYLGSEETEILVALIASVQPKIVFEFGVQLGRTARMLLGRIASIEHYIGIDVPFEHMPALPVQKSEVPATPGLYARDDQRFSLLICNGTQRLEPDMLEPCDAVFIDGDHSRAAVLHDSRLARALVRPGGIIVWHDYGNTATEVAEALDQLVLEDWPLLHVYRTWLAYCRC